jgi:fructose-1,6-bisphosphatase I
MNLGEYLQKCQCDEGLSKVVLALADAVSEIADVIKNDKGEKAGTQNTFGEDQVAMDVKSDQIVMEKLKATGEVGVVASEEMEEEVKLEMGDYGVAHDPLDGSSLIDVNLAVGSIFGLYKTGTFYGVKGDEQLGAMLGVYGPRTAIFLTLRKGLAYFVFDGEQFVLQQDGFELAEESKMFAPGNLRACSEREDYVELLTHWVTSQYKLRYSGGMVPDVGQILIKGGGVFIYPGYGSQPDGKLRLLYECAPVALIFEEAGGAATDGHNRILEKEVKDLAQRIPIFVGSKKEVEKAQGFLC